MLAQTRQNTWLSTRRKTSCLTVASSRRNFCAKSADAAVGKSTGSKTEFRLLEVSKPTWEIAPHIICHQSKLTNLTIHLCAVVTVPRLPTRPKVPISSRWYRAMLSPLPSGKQLDSQPKRRKPLSFPGSVQIASSTVWKSSLSARIRTNRKGKFISPPVSSTEISFR